MAQSKTFEPRYLYRYRSLEKSEQLDWVISSIANKSLFCSGFKRLNDPMEGSYEASLRLKRLSDYPLIRDRIFGDKMALGVCSFSETNDNSVMWAHYADQFKGVCIEYDFMRLRRLLPDSATFVRVSYNEQSIVVSSRDKNDTEIAMKILSSKSHRWLYEREWRLICTRVGEEGLSKNCIRKV
jgi:hypothetical protein